MKCMSDNDSIYYCLPCDMNADGCMDFMIGYKSGNSAKTCIFKTDYTGAFTSWEAGERINGIALINGCDRDFVGEI